MIPNPKWFPTSLQERAAWYQNFATQFVVVGTQLGFTALDQSAIAADNAMIQFLANTAVELEAYKDAARQFRVIITEGNIGEPMPAFPADPAFTVPASVATGIFERLDNLVKRIRVSPSYTDEIGALLGIIPSNPAPLPIADLKPAIKASGSFSGYQFSMNVSRLGMEAFKIQMQDAGTDTWKDVAFATNNPVSITVNPGTPGKPERVLVRAVLLQKNQPVGQPSDPTYVTVNP